VSKVWFFIKQYSSFQKQQDATNKQLGINVLEQPNLLLPFGNNQDKNTIPFSLIDYLELAKFSGKLLIPNNNGYIQSNVPDILKRINIESDCWIDSVKNFRRQYANFAGTKSTLMKCAHDHHHSWYKGCG